MSDARRDFTRRDREAATIFGEAARSAGIERIVYLGGLGEDGRAFRNICAAGTRSARCSARPAFR